MTARVTPDKASVLSYMASAQKHQRGTRTVLQSIRAKHLVARARQAGGCTSRLRDLPAVLACTLFCSAARNVVCRAMSAPGHSFTCCATCSMAIPPVVLARNLTCSRQSAVAITDTLLLPEGSTRLTRAYSKLFHRTCRGRRTAVDGCY